MNYIKIIAVLFVFMMGLTVVTEVLADSLIKNEHLRDISDLDINELEDTIELNNLYYQALNKSAHDAGLDIWQSGEYGLADRIDFINVYYSTQNIDVSSMHKSHEIEEGSAWDYINPLYWYNKYTGKYDTIEWEYGTEKNISAGSPVYVYPHMLYNPQSTAFDRWVIVQAFNAEGEPLHDWERWEIIGGGEYERIFKLYLGNMPRYDLYFVIHCVEIDRDIAWGENPLSFFGGIAGLIAFAQTEEGSQYAEIVEQYGAVIHGDITIEQPVMITPGGIVMDKPSSIAERVIGEEKGFFKIIDKLAFNHKIFTNPEYGLFARIAGILFTLISIVIGLMVILFAISAIRGVSLGSE